MASDKSLQPNVLLHIVYIHPVFGFACHWHGESNDDGKIIDGLFRSSHSRDNEIYWGFTGVCVCVMGQKDALPRDQMMPFVMSGWDDKRGCMSLGQAQDMARAHCQLRVHQVLTMQDAIDRVNVPRVVKFMLSDVSSGTLRRLCGRLLCRDRHSLPLLLCPGTFGFRTFARDRPGQDNRLHPALQEL